MTVSCSGCHTCEDQVNHAKPAAILWPTTGFKGRRTFWQTWVLSLGNLNSSTQHQKGERQTRGWTDQWMDRQTNFYLIHGLKLGVLGEALWAGLEATAVLGVVPVSAALFAWLTGVLHGAPAHTTHSGEVSHTVSDQHLHTQHTHSGEVSHTVSDQHLHTQHTHSGEVSHTVSDQHLHTQHTHTVVKSITEYQINTCTQHTHSDEVNHIVSDQHLHTQHTHSGEVNHRVSDQHLHTTHTQRWSQSHSIRSTPAHNTHSGEVNHTVSDQQLHTTHIQQWSQSHRIRSTPAPTQQWSQSYSIRSTPAHTTQQQETLQHVQKRIYHLRLCSYFWLFYGNFQTITYI